MFKHMNTSSFRDLVNAHSNNRDTNDIIEFLRSSGHLLTSKNGIVEVSEEIESRLRFLTDTVSAGDIVFVPGQGLFLIVEKCPDYPNVARVIRLTTNEHGHCKILGELRSCIIEIDKSLRIKKSKFQIDAIREICEKRSQLLISVTELSNSLSNMEEVNNG